MLRLARTVGLQRLQELRQNHELAPCPHLESECSQYLLQRRELGRRSCRGRPFGQQAFQPTVEGSVRKSNATVSPPVLVMAWQQSTNTSWSKRLATKKMKRPPCRRTLRGFTLPVFVSVAPIS